MAEEKQIRYEYCGNLFYLEEHRRWYSSPAGYTIRRIVMENSRLQLPDTCRDMPVTRWEMRDGAPLSQAKMLSIPSRITEIAIDNALFPALERVEVQPGHPKFLTDGRMLFSADGRELLYSLAAGNQERAVVPREVRKIARSAFPRTGCSEILFENPDVSVERDAFTDSEWLRRQGDYCIVGNLFFKLNRSVERLTVPDGIKRIHESAFWKAVPGHLDTPVLPSRSNMEDLGGRGYGRCGELTIRSRNAKPDFGLLRCWQGLQAVNIAEGHKKYRSREGVVFSKDGKSLEFYPQGRQAKFYSIPEGVAKIGRSAFLGQGYLEEAEMPDTVTAVGMSAFFGCGALRKVRFSENIRELPDACAYQNGGVFEDCGALAEVELPRKLLYLGSYAFCGSGLRRVGVNRGLRQMGEYALAAKGLREVALPVSLERVGKGALFYAGKVGAYIGTARGLVAAVNAASPGYTDKCANLEWSCCEVTAYKRRGNGTERFLIPGSLKRNAAYHLDMAWNGDEIDYEEYDACFDAIQDSEERMEFAWQGLLRLGEQEDSPYLAYIRHSALKIAVRLVEEGREEAFLDFLRRGFLSEAALSKLLKLTNRKQMTTCSAYILKMQNERGGRNARRFVL